MAQYIVYSGGANGYKLYDAHPDFPQEYRMAVENVYVKQRIVGPFHKEGSARCYRFAPVKDRYLFSAIYKDCVCEGEKRPFYATVNWLFTAREADALLARNVQYGIEELVQQSDDILLRSGYTIPPFVPVVSDGYESITVNAQQALLTAAYNGMCAACDENGDLSAQVFLGCKQTDSLFLPVFWLMNVIPMRMRRHISFHIGAVAAEETTGVALSVTYDDMFELMSAKGHYSGAMAIEKVILIKDAFSAFSSPTPLAKAFLLLSNEQKRRLSKLFLHADNCGGFWQYIAAVHEKNTAKTQGAYLAMLIGERGFADAVHNGVFSEQELLEMYREKKKFPANSPMLALLEEKTAPLRGHTKGKSFTAPYADTDEKAEFQETNEKAKHRKKRTYDNETEQDWGEARPDEDRDRQEPKHHKKKCKKSLKKVCARLLAVVWRVLLPLLCILLAWLVPVGLGVGMFFLGVLGVKILPPQFLWTAYGAQLAVLIVLAIPLGYFAISLTKCQIARWKKDYKERKQDKEDKK